MSMSCPDPELLSAYRAGRLDPSARESLEAHASACARCLRALLVLGGLETWAPPPLPSPVLARLEALAPPPRRSPWVWGAAAAALMAVIAGGWGLASREARHEGNGPARAHAGGPPLFPEGPLGRQERPVAVLGGGMDLVLSQGTRVRVEGSGRQLRLEAGMLWVVVEGGDPVSVQVPGGLLVLEKGLLAARAGPAPRAMGGGCWFREAMAGDAGESAEAWLLEGTLKVIARGGELRIGSPSRLSLGGSPQVFPLPEAGRDALLKARSAAVAGLPGRRLFPDGSRLDAGVPRLQASVPVAGAYRWVTVLSDRKPGTEIGLDFPVEGGWHGWTLGLGGESSDVPETVEISWDGEFLVGRVNGLRRFAMGPDRLRQELPCPSPQGWALSVWGGSVRVDRTLLQEAQP